MSDSHKRPWRLSAPELRTPRQSLRGMVAALALAVLCWGCGDPEGPDELGEPGQAGGAPPNLLLITIDTTRTDRLGCYGAEGANTPTLDALAARGTVFEEAYTPAPMTLPAHATLLTGFLPPQHGARVNGEHRLGTDLPTLAEEFADEGYRTGAFIAAFVLNHRFGLARGFDHYDDDLHGAYEQEVASGLARYRPGNLVVDSAIEWIQSAEASEPFFAWVHLYDAHYPWFSHEPSEESPAPGSGTYEGEIAFVDQQIGRLMSLLDERDITQRTVVMTVADHGEGLGDHGEIEHAYLLNEEVLHVPWIVAGPGVEPGHRVPALVSLEDFRPTVNELLGLSTATVARGRSLVPSLAGGSMPSGVSYAETDLPWTAYRWSPQRSLTTEHWKYIRTPRTELYNRGKDREELINLVEVKPDVVAELEERLSAIEAEMGTRESEAAALSSEEVEQLAALGYTVGGGGDAPEDRQLADVKERLPAKKLAAELRKGKELGTLKPEEILEMAGELVRQSPETPAFHGYLGEALVAEGEVEAGIAELKLVVQLEPTNGGAHYVLGDALQQAGFTPKAREHLEKAIELDPNNAAAHVGMGNVIRSEGRPDLAAGRYAEALELRDDRYPEAHFNLALTFLDRGNREKAAEHFLLAAEQRPGWLLAHTYLANLYANWGKAPEAIEHYEISIEMDSDNAGLHFDFGVMLDAVDRTEEAREQYLLTIALAPEAHRPHVNLGNQAFDAGDDAEALRKYEEALQLSPGSAEATAKLARFLATCPDENYLDAERARALAERAVDLSQSNSPTILDTLAAACAATGDYAAAISNAHHAQKLARAQNREELANAIEERLTLYALKKPYLKQRTVSEAPLPEETGAAEGEAIEDGAVESEATEGDATEDGAIEDGRN